MKLYKITNTLRESLIDAGRNACDYMNCKIFVQTVANISRLDDLPSSSFISIDNLSVGDILKWGNGLHWAIYIGNGEIMEVPEWGGAPRTIDFNEMLEEEGYELPDLVYSTQI